MDDDNFGVRWTGFLAPKVTGKYQLGGVGMNAFELYLDGKQLVRSNNVHERAYSTETVDLEAGKLYPIRLDFHEMHQRRRYAPGLVACPARDLRDAARWMPHAGRRGGDGPGPFAAARRRGDEGAGGGLQGGDRVDLGMPAAQEDAAAKGGRRSASRSCWCC